MSQIRVSKQFIFHNRLNVYISQLREHQCFIAKPAEFIEITDLYKETQPHDVLDPTEAQVLMDDLWDCGVRPSEGTGSAGAMAATQKHLEDMRTLVFKPKTGNKNL